MLLLLAASQTPLLLVPFRWIHDVSEKKTDEFSDSILERQEDKTIPQDKVLIL